jgi:hypothetical protein
MAAPEGRRRIDRLLILKAQSWRRQAEQGRPTTRDEGEHEVVRSQTTHHLEHALGGTMPAFVGYGVCGFDDLDPVAGNGVAVARNHEPAQRSRPCILDGLGHCRGCLARSNYDCLAFRRLGQMGRNATLWRCGGDRRIKHAPEQLAWLIEHQAGPFPDCRQSLIVSAA